MKVKLYTQEHDKMRLDSKHYDELFTGPEYSKITEEEVGENFQTKESLIEWYLKNNCRKLAALDFVYNRIKEEGYKNILSLGAGPCVLEYFLKKELPTDCNVVATDFNSFYIRQAKRHFPSIISVEFDFFKKDICSLKEKLRTNFDVAVFFGSAYVMDDQVFIKLFADLKEIGIKEVIDFHAGYIPFRDVPRLFVSELRWNFLNALGIHPYRGKMHGYRRTRDELLRLYKAAGFNSIKEEFSIGGYEYTAVCK